jgi:hypothetical protein
VTVFFPFTGVREVRGTHRGDNVLFPEQSSGIDFPLVSRPWTPGSFWEHFIRIILFPYRETYPETQIRFLEERPSKPGSH